jgi:hypothetical protein
MLRPLRSLGLALVTVLAGLGGDAAPATAAPASSAAAIAGATVQARPAKRARKPGKRAKRVTKARATAGKGSRRRAPRALGSNMPEGWTWPPSAAMKRGGKACTTRLDALGVAWRPAGKLKKIATPITVPSMTFGGVKLSPTFRPPPFVMDCHLALALATFGKDLHDLGVREVRFSRIYGYTPVRTGGRTRSVLSRHALGLAIDIRGIVDDTGREAVVVRDYLADDPLLLRVEDFLNDSGGFRTVLTPRNDPKSHDDHFHVEVALEYGP